MRVVLVLIFLAAGLSSCGTMIPVAEAPTPMFTAKDADGAPQMRDGVWLERSAACPFDPRRPVRTWPACADWSVVRGSELLSWEGQGMGWESRSYLLVAGAPLIRQTTPATGPKYYRFQVVLPDRFNAQSQIVGYQAWPVTCGAVAPLKPNYKAEAAPGKFVRRYWLTRLNPMVYLNQTSNEHATEWALAPLADAELKGFVDAEPVAAYPGFTHLENDPPWVCTPIDAEAIRSAASRTAIDMQQVEAQLERMLKTPRLYRREAAEAGLSRRKARKMLERLKARYAPDQPEWIREIKPDDF